MRVLLVEDDADTAQFITKGLGQHNHVVDVANDGSHGLFMALEHPYDMLIVDRMVPKLDGLSIIKTLRESGNQTPVLVLSALHQVEERVKGLSTGADDYLVKPFAFSELLARMDALTRRSRTTVTETVLKIGPLEMDFRTRKVSRGGKDVPLQNREFRLLEFLMRHAGQVVTRTMLLENVWDVHFDPQTNVIDVHISRLRQKLDEGHDGESLIHTVRGVGYRLKV
ncbi:response regulator [bacterium]|nr:response regulator [bacterium]